MKCQDCGKQFNPNHPQASASRGPKCNQKYLSGLFLPDYVSEVASRIKDHDVYLVGGSVRDFVLGKKPKDFDLATSASKEELETIFPESDPVGKSFGVFKVPANGDIVEVGSFRKDGLYADGRRPEEIENGTIEDDVQRRDFTINGMFFDLKKKSIVDKVGGLDDIKNKTIRAIGNPDKRFQEDYLRMIRALRFMVVLDFKLEDKTKDSILRNLENVKQIPKERIKVEIDKIFSSPNFHNKIDEFQELGFFKKLFNKDVDTKYLKEKKPTGLYVYSECLDSEEDMRKFKFSLDEIKALKKIKEVERDLCGLEKLSKSQKNKLGYFLTLEGLNFSKTKHISEIELTLNELKKNPIDTSLFTSGQELVSLGFQPGKEIGSIISELDEAVFGRTVASKDAKMAFLVSRKKL